MPPVRPYGVVSHSHRLGIWTYFNFRVGLALVCVSAQTPGVGGNSMHLVPADTHGYTRACWGRVRVAQLSVNLAADVHSGSRLFIIVLSGGGDAVVVQVVGDGRSSWY